MVKFLEVREGWTQAPSLLPLGGYVTGSSKRPSTVSPWL